jgi:O-antigen/teichoic acid export membrane protein
MTLYQRLKASRDALLNQSNVRASSLVQVFLRGIFAAVTGTAAAYALGALTTILIARALGVERYGHYTTLMASLGLLSNLLGLGLDTWLVNHGSRQLGGLVASMWQVIYVKCIGAALMLAVLAIAWLNSPIDISILMISSIGIIADGFSRTGFATLRARAQNARVALLEVAAPALLLAGLFVLSQGGITIEALVVVQALCTIVVLIITFANVISKPLQMPRPALMPVLRMSWVFIASDVVANVYSLVGTAAVGLFAGATAAGLFKPAISIISLTYIIPSLVFWVGLPLLNRAVTRAAFDKLLLTMLACAVAYGVITMAGMWLVGQPAVQLIFGRDYLPALPYVQIMSLIPLMKSVSFVCAAVMLSQNKQLLRLGLQSVVVVVSIVGALTLIPAAGAIGASWLQLLIEFLLLVLYVAGAVWSLRSSPLHQAKRVPA